MEVDRFQAPRQYVDGEHHSLGFGGNPTPPSHANNLEDDFASKTTLLDGGGCGHHISNVEHMKDASSSDDDLIIEDGYESYYEKIENRGLVWEICHRYITENGKTVEKPANKWFIYLKDGPPKGCGQRTYHIDILQQVVGSDARKVFEEAITETLVVAILTDEECAKLKDMEQVEKIEEAGSCVYFH